MISKLLIIILGLTTYCICAINIEYPNQYEITSSTTINIVANSTVNKGFMMVDDQIVPIRKKTTIKNIPLQLGMNSIVIHILNDQLQLQPPLTTTIKVYRQLSLETSVKDIEAIILTELAIHHHIQIFEYNHHAINTPILKKNMYALLMWFNKKNQRKPIPHTYKDMAMEPNYLRLYEFYPELLPRPVLDSFYPNGYSTREEFINLLLLATGSSEQISTSMIIKHRLDIPNSLKPILPKSWRTPMAFVTHQEVLTTFIKLFNYSIPTIAKNKSIEWPTTLISQNKFNNLSKLMPHISKYKTAIVKKFKPKQPAIKKQEDRAITAKISTIKKETISRTLPLKKIKKTTITTSRSPKKNQHVIIVQPGDSIQKIARQYYGDPSKWKQLVKINQLKIQKVTINGQLVSTVHIEPGQHLKLF